MSRLRRPRASGVPAAGRHRADARVREESALSAVVVRFNRRQEPVRAAGRPGRGGGARPGRGAVPGGRGGAAPASAAGRAAAGGGGRAVHGGVRGGDPRLFPGCPADRARGDRRARLGAGQRAGGAVGSTGLRHRRGGVLVSGHSGTSRAGCREGGEVERGVVVPVEDQAADVACVGPDVQRQLGFHRAAPGTGLGGGVPAVGHDEAGAVAVIASVRHVDTPYDRLLMSGVPRHEARRRIAGLVETTLREWWAVGERDRMKGASIAGAGVGRSPMGVRISAMVTVTVRMFTCGDGGWDAGFLDSGDRGGSRT